MGLHVPQGAHAVPPPLDGLSAAPSAMHDAVKSCVRGRQTPMSASDVAEAELPEEGPTNTRWAPAMPAIRNVVKHRRRQERGGCMDDATRCHLMVTTMLIQRGFVLCYKPGEQLVLSSSFALAIAKKYGRNMIVTDAKVDTTMGRSIFSSVRCGTPWCSQPLAVSVTPNEVTNTIYLMLFILAINIPCDDPACSHTLLTESGADGSYRQWRCCARHWRPACMIDKHWPSFCAVAKAGLAMPFLCAWHGEKAFDEYLGDEIGIKGDAVRPLTWAFRLFKRSTSVAQAREMRNQLATFVMSAALAKGAAWTPEQAEQVVSYLDRRWMYPDVVLKAWIDGPKLEQKDYFDTSGDAEASHVRCCEPHSLSACLLTSSRPSSRQHGTESS